MKKMFDFYYECEDCYRKHCCGNPICNLLLIFSCFLSAESNTLLPGLEIFGNFGLTIPCSTVPTQQLHKIQVPGVVRDE